jgi:hypothetical protein
MRKLPLVLGCTILLLGFGRVFGDPVNLTLLNVSPGGDIDMFDSGVLPSGDYGDGVLDWSNNYPTISTPNVFTYCVDVNSVIYFGGLYHFNSEATLPSGGPFTQAEMYGIDELWNAQLAGFLETLGNNIGMPALDSNNEAADLQVALWDVIYDGGSATGTGPLSFSNNTAGGNLDTTAFAWANAAATAAQNDITNNTPPSSPLLNFLDATDGGQNQIFIGGVSSPPPSTTPLPTAATSCLVLLGVVGSLGVAAKVRSSKRSADAAC